MMGGLLVNIVQGSWMEKERQHSLSNIYLSTPLMLFTQVGDLPVFFIYASHKF